jgi:hypothetical protein
VSSITCGKNLTIRLLPLLKLFSAHSFWDFHVNSIIIYSVIIVIILLWHSCPGIVNLCSQKLARTLHISTACSPAVDCHTCRVQLHSIRALFLLIVLEEANKGQDVNAEALEAKGLAKQLRLFFIRSAAFLFTLTVCLHWRIPIKLTHVKSLEIIIIIVVCSI